MPGDGCCPMFQEYIPPVNIFAVLRAALQITGAIAKTRPYRKQKGHVLKGMGVYKTMGAARTNPRHKNGNMRRKHRARFKAMQMPCGICGGRLGPIHYDEPSDAKHPLSFVIDEIKPVSKWRQFGYVSAAAAAQDWNNLQPAHYCCNQAKGNKTNFVKIKTANVVSGDW